MPRMTPEQQQSMKLTDADADFDEFLQMSPADAEQYAHRHGYSHGAKSRNSGTNIRGEKWSGTPASLRALTGGK